MKKELMKELKENGIRAAVKKLSDYEYRDYCLFNADVAWSVLPIFEAENGIKAPRLAIEGVRKWHRGDISDEELKVLSAYADAAADAAADDSDAAACAAAAAAHAADAADTAYTDASYSSAASAAYAYYAAAAADKKWEEIEQIFIKHFGDDS
jgi:hypothetical protein